MTTPRLIWGSLSWRGRLHFLGQALRPRAWWRQALVRRYPDLFRYPGWDDPHQTLMAFGFAHGDGWARILWGLARDLRTVAHTTGIQIRVTQVKEKFGTLHVYCGIAPESPDAWKAVRAVVQRAEQVSARTCEDCGQPGQLMWKDQSWYRTVCRRCAGTAYEPVATE